jgi:putative effector of murein hydrolase LrgA (UPF0299 family)
MISGLLQLLVFQGIGELLARFLVPAVPGPVLGLLGLLVWLRLRGQVAPGLDTVATAFSRHLGLLFVPAAVGVVMFLPQLREHLAGLSATLVVSVVATIATSGLLLRLLGPGDAPDAPTGAEAATGRDGPPPS